MHIMHITIVLAYENARDEYRLWAHEEEKINFRKENLSIRLLTSGNIHAVNNFIA